MRLLLLGGTRFIGDRIVREALGRGDEVIVVHRGVTEPDDVPGSGALTHLHVDRAHFAEISGQVRALRPDAVIDTRALTRADADAVLPHLPDVPLVLLSSMDVYRAYELLLADRTDQPGRSVGVGREVGRGRLAGETRSGKPGRSVGVGWSGKHCQPVPVAEDGELRRGRYPLRGMIDGRDDYEKLDVEPGYLARGGTVLRLAAIYGERDPQRREEFILRRVRAGRTRIPVGAGTFLWTRGYVGDVASAVLAVLDSPAAAAGEIFNVGDLATDTMRDYARRILAAAGHEAELVTVPDSVVPADLDITRATAQHLLCDCGKLARALGWRPGDAGDSIIRSVRWHLANPPTAAADFADDDQALWAA
jgi:nucleoside-diphosphate-sugar epimerase